MKSKIIVFVLISFFFISCNGQNPKSYESIPPTAFAEKIKETPNAQLFDVRSTEEFDGQHIANAININWNGEDFVGKISNYDKTKPVFVYCLSGGRSKKAAEKMQELGFKKIYELEGGIMKWNASGIEASTDKIIGMCDQEYGELLKTDKKVLVNFYAEWCAPCKKMEPYIKKMQLDLADKTTIIRRNADEDKTLVKELKIDELPTFLLYDKGKVIWKHVGFISEEDLTKQLQ